VVQIHHTDKCHVELSISQTQGLQSAQATTAEEEETTPSTSSVLGNVPPSSPVASTSQEPQEAPTTTRAVASTSTASAPKDPLTGKVGLLVQFMLYKYKLKEPIKKAEMLKIINKRYREHFPEIFKRTSERMELVFGLELKEIKPGGHSYTLMSTLNLTSDSDVSNGWGFPKNGLLMPLLGVIFLNGNCTSEEGIWEFLNILGIYDGKRHFIFGEPRKLITQDLVQEKYLEYRQLITEDLVKLKYLEYRQVPNSNPACYEFLWGPRAHAETSKMKVLEFWAKINHTVPSAFHSWYEEALRDEEDRVKDDPPLNRWKNSLVLPWHSRLKTPG
uniref:MAGE domain-containing protein n=1 Tax=Canis lupus dingo TaxID=286419 RepID=A0A8C0JZI6_CANLU